jgi:predicted RNA binding protein YcfA (HicA-like mRNA interferase family)
MGRLAGFKYREVARKLRALGYVYDRPGPGSHEVWRHALTGRKVTLPHHARDMAEGARFFGKQASLLMLFLMRSRQRFFSVG